MKQCARLKVSFNKPKDRIKSKDKAVGIEIMDTKLNDLKKIIEGYGKMAVAFSGGVDSTFLLAFAAKCDVELIAFTANASNFASDEIEYARKFCSERGIKHVIVDVAPEALPEFSNNPPDRCYICKKAVFGKLLAESRGYVLTDGTNADDGNDYRPGMRALEELEIASPLRDAGLAKKEIRQALHEMGIEIWDKPAFACLASRVPYGERITVEKLKAIYALEKALRDKGFKQLRVRAHEVGSGSQTKLMARIEILPEDRSKFFDLSFMDDAAELAKNAGFEYAALDLTGYRMGSLNSAILK